MFDFQFAKDLAPLREFVREEGATQAVEFGMSMTNAGYNIYVPESLEQERRA